MTENKNLDTFNEETDDIEKAPTRFVYKLNKKVSYNEKEYDSLKIDFSPLTGRDAREIKNELARLNINVIIPTFSDDYLVRVICKAAKEIAKEVGAKAIIVESATGRVARAMVHYRPEVPVIAVVTSERVCRKLSLNWGVTALVGEEKLNSDDITTQAMEKALSTGLVKRGDTVVVLSSNKTVPTSSTDSLNIRIL